MKTSKYKQWRTVMILVLLGLAIAQPGQAQTRLHLPDLTPYQITFTYSGEYVRNAEQFVFTRLDPDSGRFDGVIRRFTHGKHEDTPVSGEISNVLNERVSTVEGQAYKIKFATPNNETTYDGSLRINTTNKNLFMAGTYSIQKRQSASSGTNIITAGPFPFCAHGGIPSGTAPRP